MRAQEDSVTHVLHMASDTSYEPDDVGVAANELGSMRMVAALRPALGRLQRCDLFLTEVLRRKLMSGQICACRDCFFLWVAATADSVGTCSPQRRGGQAYLEVRGDKMQGKCD